MELDNILEVWPRYGASDSPKSDQIVNYQDAFCITGLPIHVNDNSPLDSQLELRIERMYSKCNALAGNLWWSWYPDAIKLFRELDPIRWRQLDHNPIPLLQEFTPERLEMRAAELVLYSRINSIHRRWREYQSDMPLWERTRTRALGAQPVAYFSLEFGIHESIPIYSGGLGVLSGEYIRSASDLGVPLVAIGLFYDQGYFKQHLDKNGWQQEEYLDTKVENLPIEPACGPDGQPITVQIQTRSGRLLAKVWLMRVGRVSLYLLDCDVEGNSPEDREVTARLYGGDSRTRIRQELILGVGGIRALKALGINAAVYHLNESHCTFAVLEAIRQRMKEDGVSFEVAHRKVSQCTVYTDWTESPGDYDFFTKSLIEEHLGLLCDELGISIEHFMGFGCEEPLNEQSAFCMAMLARRLLNGFESLRIEDARGKRGIPLAPEHCTESRQAARIVHGVHVQSWLGDPMRQAYDRLLPRNWPDGVGDPAVWQPILEIDPGELWEIHQALTNLLLAFVRRRVSRQCRRRGESDEIVDAARMMMDPNVLTIGFARRFTTTERAYVILHDLDRLRAMVNDPDRPVQLIFAGKAHPANHGGKELIQRIANLRFDPRFANKIVFVEDYDINVCRHLVQGVHVWLSCPPAYSECPGTSRQKVVLNGGLNLSTLDVWWGDAYDGSNGFAITNATGVGQQESVDSQDAECLYRALEEEVVPLFYDRDYDGLPQRWIKRMKRSIRTLAWRSSADRMVSEYAQKYYLPIVAAAQ